MPLRLGGFDMTDVVSGGQGGATTLTQPFTISIKGNKDNGFKIKVYPGSVGILPNNIFNEFPFSPDSITYVKLRIETNGKIPTGATIQVDSSIMEVNQPVLNSGPPIWNVYIGVVSGSTIYQILNSNINLDPYVVALVNKVVQNPFEDPYDRMISWSTI